MNQSPPATFELEMARDLRTHLTLCQELLALAEREDQALSPESLRRYQPLEFFRQRKGVVPRLEASLRALRQWRQRWEQLAPDQRPADPEIRSLCQSVQGLLMKLLLLDRENQARLAGLRLGGTPGVQVGRVAPCTPPDAAGFPSGPHGVTRPMPSLAPRRSYVADRYQRNSQP